ncbi:transketolase [Syntrophotalea acetylenivorans]|uniref:Transketolase n=1 Tax=Syntrophotalea acetylenivorans TaxID=1842532 RepID=A0A1L3GQX2_9BACT|nr:transketolase [Syntrophotalea acetylenivorans]APG28356.1 transketolase [Syntrophotalea acetylenivorans]
MLTDQQIRELEETARHLRVEVLKMLHTSQSGHTGGSLSAIDVMTVLYYQRMRHNPSNPAWEDRDRFVLSKGHAAPALYACLAGCDYFPREDLKTLRRLGSHLQGHPDMNKTPGVDVCTGSLGQGISQAVGLAMAARLGSRPSRVYTLLGDGEVQEGQVWEAAMSAAHYGLGNLCAIVDQNGLQIDGATEDVMNVGPLGPKFLAFNWHVLEVDGHDIQAINRAFDEAEAETERPTAIIARTVKGKGVSFFEHKASYHGVAPSDDELERALAALSLR